MHNVRKSIFKGKPNKSANQQSNKVRINLHHVTATIEQKKGNIRRQYQLVTLRKGKAMQNKHAMRHQKVKLDKYQYLVYNPEWKIKYFVKWRKHDGYSIPVEGSATPAQERKMDDEQVYEHKETVKEEHNRLSL